MIEKSYPYTQMKEKVIEKIVDLDSVAINHMVLLKGERLPQHYSNSNVYMIVVTGTVTLGLDAQEAHSYAAGNIVEIPINTKMDVVNENDEILEFFVVKAPGPRSLGSQ